MMAGRSTKRQRRSTIYSDDAIKAGNTNTNTRLSFEGASKNGGKDDVDRFSPLDLNELAVHKRKVSDVEDWLRDALNGNIRRKLLVLRGPAGSGKSTTVSLLARQLNFEILEWKSPPVSDQHTEGYVSLARKFDDFLGRGDSFGGLDLDGDDYGDTTKNVANDKFSRRIILIEEFPTLNRNSSSLAAFRASLQRCLAPSILALPTGSDQHQNGQPSTPIVIIVSETHLNSGPSLLDNITVYRLLGAEIYNNPCTTIIDFNIIAPTFMSKALKLILDKHLRSSRNHKNTITPGSSTLRSLSKTGDIRNAVNALEFLCIRADQVKSVNTHNLIDQKVTCRSQAKTEHIENDALELITQRETSLGIFHAVGKIVYNKREEAITTPEGLNPTQPPNHMYQHHRPKASQVSVNDLSDEMGTDIQTFISALHENYVQSCDCHSFMDCLNGCIDALSDSDILCADNRSFIGSRRSAGVGAYRGSSGVDILRQDELSYQVATRGPVHDLMAVNMIPRMDLLLDQLPYMATLTADQEEARSLNRITGLCELRSRVDFDGDGSDYALDKMVESSIAQDTWSSTRWKKPSKDSGRIFGPQRPLSSGDTEENLVLSDDDILDD
ncbi:Cell cycle checkpoint protein rad17 [Aspergillus nanangensis]|uniref:Cell cycle checkpoint protein rad17 n=1 Tax=Aspergillus nanangensis TaxID=2582783 RepID=A0AAD4GTF1_ASPNN|nr:Cell cycle checkpoint protein rad17 [Aspergillus nanangensis]